MEPPVRLLLIDSQVLFRSSLSWILSAEPGFEVAAECSTPAEALDVLSSSAERPVDLVLMDFDMGTDHADSFICAARKAGYEGRFLIVTGSPDARSAALALRLGASGIFLKSDQPPRLVQTIRTIMSGDVWVDRTIIQLLANQLIDRWPDFETDKPVNQLGAREKQVLMGILRGHSNREIGASLGMTESSVKNCLQHLFAMTGVRTRSQLVRMALQGSFGEIPRSAPGDLATASSAPKD